MLKRPFLGKSLVITFLSSFLTITSSPTAFATQPQTGGTLVIGRGADSIGLDPASRADGESLSVTANIFDTLVTFKPGSAAVAPSLAEKWDISPDGKSYTFYLIKHAKFHDDTPVNADAVIFSFNRQLDPNHEAYKFGKPYGYIVSMGLSKLIQNIEKIDEYTLRFNLAKPHSPFLATLSMAPFAIVSPTALMKYKTAFARKPVGSGPFKFVRWDRNQRIVLQANTNYWQRPPYIKTLIIRSIPDNNTRLLEMLAGNMHIMDNPDSNHIDTIKAHLKDKVKLGENPTMNLGYLAINLEKKPFDDVRVRRAVAHAINKKAIIDTVYNGRAQVAKTPIPPMLWGYNEQIKDYDYNPAKARELLAEAGLSEGFETTIWAMPVPRPYMPDGRKVAESIQGDLAKVGIKAKIVSYDWATYLAKVQVGEHDMVLLGWTGDISDPDNFIYVLLDKENAVKPAQNLSFYKSDRLHQVLVQAQIEVEQEKRAALYRKAQEIIHEDIPMISLAHPIETVPMRRDVENFTMDPTGRRHLREVWLKR